MSYMCGLGSVDLAMPGSCSTTSRSSVATTTAHVVCLVQTLSRSLYSQHPLSILGCEQECELLVVQHPAFTLMCQTGRRRVELTNKLLNKLLDGRTACAVYQIDMHDMKIAQSMDRLVSVSATPLLTQTMHLGARFAASVLWSATHWPLGC